MNNNFTLQTPMKEVETRFPFTRSTLHSQFHIGGCANCGYEPTETIEEVAKKYSKDPAILLESLIVAFEDMNQAEIQITDFGKILQSQEHPLLIDVREEWEYNVAHIPNSILMTESNFPEIVSKSKEMRHVIVICHHGMRSMNATLYLREHGVHQAKSLAGGIDAYSLKIDPTLQRY
jgi:rhodanese-related sulfurtransferase